MAFEKSLYPFRHHLLFRFRRQPFCFGCIESAPVTKKSWFDYTMTCFCPNFYNKCLIEKFYLHCGTFSATISVERSRVGRHPVRRSFTGHPEPLFRKCHTSLGSEMTGTRRNRYKALRICPDALFYTVLRQRREEPVQTSATADRIMGFFQKITGRRRKKV